MTLNRFQTKTKEQAEYLLVGAGIQVDARIDAGDSASAWVLRFADCESWIYPDGADIIGSDIDKVFEIYDYDSLRELAADYIKNIAKLVADRQVE